MKDINDEQWEKDTMKYADEMVERAKTRSENVLNILEERERCIIIIYIFNKIFGTTRLYLVPPVVLRNNY